MRRVGLILAGLLVAGIVAAPLSRVFHDLQKTREAMRTFTALVSFGNAQDLQGVRSLCTKRYLDAHPIIPATEGGVVGLPRNIHKNFQVWNESGQVWLCPTDRVGPVYRLYVETEGGGYKFDGPVGLLRPGGRTEPLGDIDQ